MVCDRSTGQGVTRTLRWEIAALDPQSEDILEELSCQGNQGSQKGSLANELSAALAKRGGPPVGTTKIVQ